MHDVMVHAYITVSCPCFVFFFFVVSGIYRPLDLVEKALNATLDCARVQTTHSNCVPLRPRAHAAALHAGTV